MPALNLLLNTLNISKLSECFICVVNPDEKVNTQMKYLSVEKSSIMNTLDNKKDIQKSNSDKSLNFLKLYHESYKMQNY